MKNLIWTILLTSTLSQVIGQEKWLSGCLSFDDTNFRYQFTIDTANQNNIWQIAQPAKPTLNAPLHYSEPKVIITDSVNPYPPNNNSSFIITKPVDEGDYYGLSSMIVNYFVETDSLHDFGKIELSVDTGQTWIDIINDTVYELNFQFWSGKPTLTGNSNGWHSFDITFVDLGSIFNIQLDDLLMFKFSFISDSIPDNLDGLMYDDICFWVFIEGVTETRFQPLYTKSYPNPVVDEVTIEFDNPANEEVELSIYTEKSRNVYRQTFIGQDKINVNAEFLEPGIYIYKLTNSHTLRRGWGKIVVVK